MALFPLLLLSLQAALASATLNLFTFSNSAFAGSPAASQPSNIDSLPVPALSSLRFTGTIAPAHADLLLFRAVFSTPLNGSLLLWVDDHLLIDTAGRGLTAYINYSFIDSTPLPLRLDYINASPMPTTLSLHWQGNFTSDSPVPASSLTPATAPHDVQREALRQRMSSPPWGWGTYYNPSMGTHVAMPSSFAVTATIGRRSTGALLGDIIVFRQANPAITRIGGHTYNGSTFTEVSVGYWLGTPCTTLLQTAVGADGGLLFLATTNGTAAACADLLLVLDLSYLWGRVGGVQLLAPGHAQATPAGLPPIDVFTAAPPVSFNGSNPSRALRLALPLASGGLTGYSTGAPVPLQRMAAAIAAAKAAHESSRSRYGPSADLMDAYDAQQSVIAWNTMYSPYEGVVTPVSRGWNHGAGYVTFCWDNLFLAWMASLEAGSLDIAYSNLMQVVLSRTVYGFVPNYHSGTHDSGDRSEPQLGALLTLQVYSRWQEAWVVQAVFEALLGWQEWVWQQRTHAHAAGPLVVLGSDPNFPEDEGGMGTFGRAVLESGIDNGPAYILDPVADWDAGSRRVKQYDVGASALYVSECLALAQLAPVAGRGELVPLLQARAAAVAGAMEAAMWNAEEGVYESTLWNGTWHKRRMPTAFYPLLTRQLPPARAAAMLPLLTSPLGFCVNASSWGAGNAQSTLLLQFRAPGGGGGLACASDACIADALNARYTWVRAEGLVQLAAAPPAAGPVPLTLFLNAATGAYATVAGGAPPAPGFQAVRVEGYCSASPPGAQGDGVPLTLWAHSGAGGGLGGFLTCAGNPACAQAARAAGYTLANASMCWGANATTVEQLPCKYGCNSVERRDDSFFENDYWRGRIWGPQVALVWLGLRNYDAVPEARSARQVLVEQALRLELQEWRLFRQVTENHNGIFGVGEDVGNADPMYRESLLVGASTRTRTHPFPLSSFPITHCHLLDNTDWGALLGHVALLEAGF